MTPFQPRATVSDEPDGLRISIPARREWVILFLVCWLAFWTFEGLHSWRGRINHFSLFLIVWAFGGLWASYVILRTLGGKETIIAGPEALKRTRQVFGLGWSNTYQVREIRNLRFQRGLGRRPSRMAFDYGAKTITFGVDIEEAEACELMRRIRQRCSISDSSGKP